MRRVLGPILGLALITTLAAAPAAANPFPDQIALPDGWQPEGITSNGTTLYVGSLVDGAIWRGTLQSGGAEFIEGDAEAGLMAAGLDYDGEHDRLWVAGAGGDQIRVYDATTGDLLETYTFDSGFINDIVATENAVYATDSGMPQLLVVPLGPGGALPAPGDAFALPLTGEISYSAGFNANGIAWARGQLVIVQSNEGLVFTVDSDGVATQVELRDGADEYLVVNGDGIEIHGNTLAVVRNFNNLVATFRLNGPLTSGVLTDEIESDLFAIPTTATWAAGDLWVVNARFDIQPPPPDLPYWITRVPGL